MRLLIVPGNNSLSHGLKSLAIQRGLVSRGHEAVIAVSEDKAGFYQRQNASYTLIRDIQEIDGSSFPTMNWFRDKEKINECIESETALIREYRPDRVLGIFRFTLKASASLCGIPFDSLICGCMLPDIHGALGFHNEVKDPSGFRDFINMFFRSAGIKMSRAISDSGLEPIDDVREMLTGERTFLWDIPEFMPLPEDNRAIHVGPLFWNEWQHGDVDVNSFAEETRPIAILAFGTCNGNISQLMRLINILHDLGYKIIVAAGGQEKLLSSLRDNPLVKSFLFAPIDKILPYVSLVVCHGGQMTIFEALASEVPVAVVPFHPEQAHNGVCLEKIGCGCMLTPACRFIGNPAVYSDIFERTSDDQLKASILELVENPDTKKNLKRFKNIMARYSGLETLTGFLGQ